MEIELLTPEEYKTIKNIVKEHPILTYQNNGYEYIDSRKLTPEDKEAIQKVSDILKLRVKGFSKFFNFRTSKEGEIQLRFDYYWNESFTGVGYILLDELLNGFKD